MIPQRPDLRPRPPHDLRVRRTGTAPLGVLALPGESIDELNDEATAWRLLEPWEASPNNARLERHAVNRFQARWVQEWRPGRVLLAGDDSSITEIPPFPGISEGIIIPGTPRAGELFVQADVERDGARMRFDDAVGAGWRLVTDGQVAVDRTLAEWFTSIGRAVVAVGGESALAEVDGADARWFAEHGVIVALQRPDFVLFGTAEAPSDVDLLRALQERLAGR